MQTQIMALAHTSCNPRQLGCQFCSDLRVSVLVHRRTATACLGTPPHHSDCSKLLTFAFDDNMDLIASAACRHNRATTTMQC